VTAPAAVRERPRHVFESSRTGLPDVPEYFRELWRRRQFVVEMARSTLRAQNYTSVFGQLWLILNPLLLGCVYFVLVDILSGGTHAEDYFPQLLAGLFLFTFFSGCLSQCAGSVIGASRLILNSSFPRLLLPITQVAIAFMRFLPSLLVLAVVHVLSGARLTAAALMAVPALLFVTMFGAGLGFVTATVQVYFRDFSNVLPYVIRIWLFMSPVLWALETQLQRGGIKALLIQLNPLSPMLGLWGDALVKGRMGDPVWLLTGAAWSIGALLAGTALFLWREREFSVRL
jgi:teichoic acid transport system permease protein